MHLSTLAIIMFYIVNLALSVFIVFKGRKRPAQTWAWILVMTFIPIIGFIIYLLFGRDLTNDNIYSLDDEERIGFTKELKQQRQQLRDGQLDLPHFGRLKIEPLIDMLSVSGGSLYTTGNQIDLFIDGIEKFNHLMEDMDRAEKHIHIEYFCMESDALGTAVRDHLVAAAKRGVKVKLLLDAWGSSGIKPHFLDPLREAGGEISFFLPYLMRLNYRNHRKVVVIDGKIGYIGGFNIGDEYLGLQRKMGYWRDNHLRIRGAAVRSLQSHFLKDWNASRKTNEPYQPEYFPEIEVEGEYPVQIIASGPDSPMEQIKMTYLKMINMAKEEILIQTPYYIPDDSIHEALKAALLSGVKVKLQIPDKPDHILIYWATYSLSAELVEYGAEVEIYKNGFIHAKTMIIDGKIASVGSANIDIRSFRLNFEINSVIYNQEFAQELCHQFALVSTQCQNLTMEQYEKRSHLIKIKEGLARLIQPLL